MEIEHLRDLGDDHVSPDVSFVSAYLAFFLLRLPGLVLDAVALYLVVVDERIQLLLEAGRDGE